MLSNYERLSRFYDKDWGTWCLQYSTLLDKLLLNSCSSNAHVLDIACGTGVLASMLVSKGYCVHGIDLSPNMIALANNKSIKNAVFSVADMCSFSMNRSFEAALCTFDAANYLIGKERMEGFLRSSADVLEKEGLLIFDINTDKLYSLYYYGAIQRELEGERFLQIRSFNAETRIATTEFMFDDNTVEIHTQQAWNWEEFEPLVKDAGFKVENIFGDFDERPYTIGSDRIICVLKKVT